MAFDDKSVLDEVGSGWIKTGKNGKPFWTLKFKTTVYADDSLLVFREDDEKLKKRFKTDVLTEKHPRLTIRRRRGGYEKAQQE